MTTTNRTWPEVPDRCAGRGNYKGEPRCQWLVEGWRCVNPYQGKWSSDHGNCLRYEEGDRPPEASLLMERVVLGEFTREETDPDGDLWGELIKERVNK